MIEIEFLADHPEAIPILAGWFRAQWPDYYAGRTQEEIEAGFQAEAKREGLPVRLAAYTDSRLAGTIVLRERALEGLQEFSPGLGGLYVAELFRRRGAGRALVRAGMRLARELGYEVVYAGTAAVGGMLEGLGWEALEGVEYGEAGVKVYRCTLGGEGMNR